MLICVLIIPFVSAGKVLEFYFTKATQTPFLIPFYRLCW